MGITEGVDRSGFIARNCFLALKKLLTVPVLSHPDDVNRLPQVPLLSVKGQWVMSYGPWNYEFLSVSRTMWKQRICPRGFGSAGDGGPSVNDKVEPGLLVTSGHAVWREDPYVARVWAQTKTVNIKPKEKKGHTCWSETNSP